MAVPYYGDFPTGHTGVVIPFNTFDSNDPSASVTMTNFINTDVHIHKNGSLTQRNSATGSGVAVDVDVDGITGNHWITIDLSDDDDVGFYAAGSEISVRIEGTTVDAGTINAWIGAFSIERAGGILATLKVLVTTVGAAGVGLTEAGGDGDHLTAINLPNQTMDITGSITGNLIGDVTGNVDGTVAGVTPEAAGVAPTATEIVDEWETQSQVDPTGFHVNVKEINSTSITGDGGTTEPFRPA